MGKDDGMAALDQYVAPGLRLWMLIGLVAGVLLVMVVTTPLCPEYPGIANLSKSSDCRSLLLYPHSYSAYKAPD